MTRAVRRLLVCALVVAGCHAPANFTLTLNYSPVLDEHPFAGVDTLELRWTRPGQPTVVDHVAWRQLRIFDVAAPTLVDGSQLELAAIAAGHVVAVGRSTPMRAIEGHLPHGANLYVGLVNQWVATPTAPTFARFGATATMLGESVYLAGGATRGSRAMPDPTSIVDDAETYDGEQGTFAPAANFGARIFHAASPGLVVGGLGPSGPLDDIGTLGTLPSPRWAAAYATTGTSLLLVGGYTTSDGKGGGTLATDALVFAPDTMTTTTLPLPSPRAFAVATALPDGRVLVTGGVDAAGPRADALLYSAGALSPLLPSGNARATMRSPRVGHTATALPSGDVFVVGGNDGNASVALPELFSLAAGGFVDVAGDVPARERSAAVALADGSVLVVGGEAIAQKSSPPTAVRDTLRFGSALADDVAPAPSRADANAVTLPDGSVLGIGGALGDTRTLAGGAQLFVPCSGACLAVTR